MTYHTAMSSVEFLTRENVPVGSQPLFSPLPDTENSHEGSIENFQMPVIDQLKIISDSAVLSKLPKKCIFDLANLANGAH